MFNLTWAHISKFDRYRVNAMVLETVGVKERTAEIRLCFVNTHTRYTRKILFLCLLIR